jgi:hypothetical protein
MLEHFEQKFLSDDAICSSGMPRFMTALYTLKPSDFLNWVQRNSRKYLMCSLPSILSVLECPPRLMEPPTPPTFLQMEHRQSCSRCELKVMVILRATGTYLIWDGCTRLYSKFYGATMTTSWKFNWHFRWWSQVNTLHEWRYNLR